MSDTVYYKLTILRNGDLKLKKTTKELIEKYYHMPKGEMTEFEQRQKPQIKNRAKNKANQL